MATDLKYINAALTATGNEPITSLTAPVIAATIANLNYEVMVESEIAANPWKAATKYQHLSLVDEDVHGEPPEPWQYTYQLPSDMLDIRTIKVSGIVIDYDRAGDKIFSDYDSTSVLLCHYLYRVPEADWPPWFGEAMNLKLQALFLRGIGERYKEALQMDKAAALKMQTARTRDAQAQTPRDPVKRPTLVARSA